MESQRNDYPGAGFRSRSGFVALTGLGGYGTDKKCDLKQYVEVTEDGLEYLTLRDELLQSS